jgi:ABC-2 type transport system permease protein
MNLNSVKKYSQWRATVAIAKASLIGTLRSPSAIIFSLVFPMVFIIIFGFMGGRGVSTKIALTKDCDRNNPILTALSFVPIVKIVPDKPEADQNLDLERGRIDALVTIQKNESGTPAYIVNVVYTTASLDGGNILKSVFNNILYRVNIAAEGDQPKIAAVKESQVTGRKHRTIDFILPGMLGFSLLSSGVFGTAFVFVSMRITLILKRFFATPVKRINIVAGEALSRIVFSLLGGLIIILIGHYVFGFTLIKGYVTVLNMLVLAAIGLFLFMGFGFIVSGIAKNESTVAPFANIITLPQFLMAGTFFPISLFPDWLQPISKALPLTYLNESLRLVAFEGAGLDDLGKQIAIMLAWGVAIYAAAVKVFKWED